MTLVTSARDARIGTCRNNTTSECDNYGIRDDHRRCDNSPKQGWGYGGGSQRYRGGSFERSQGGQGVTSTVPNPASKAKAKAAGVPVARK